MKDECEGHELLDLNRLFVKTAKMHRRIFQYEFQKLGLTEGQPKVLDYLHRHNGCSQKELAKHCHIQPATVTSLLAHLERRGLIYRQANQDDRRMTNVFLTGMGMELKYRINQAFRQIDDCLFEGFTSSERGQMKEYLERMYENLRRKEIEAHD